MKNRRQQGNDFEQLAKQFLQEQGLHFVCQNWQYKKIGELDLVMIDTQKSYAKQLDCLVIVEVRQRQVGIFGTANDSISKAKKQKIINTTQAFLLHFPQFENHEVRFDVVSFDTNATDLPIPIWLKSAFVVEN